MSYNFYTKPTIFTIDYGDLSGKANNALKVKNDESGVEFSTGVPQLISGNNILMSNGTTATWKPYTIIFYPNLPNSTWAKATNSTGSYTTSVSGNNRLFRKTDNGSDAQGILYTTNDYTVISSNGIFKKVFYAVQVPFTSSFVDEIMLGFGNRTSMDALGSGSMHSPPAYSHFLTRQNSNTNVNFRYGGTESNNTVTSDSAGGSGTIYGCGMDFLNDRIYFFKWNSTGTNLVTSYIALHANYKNVNLVPCIQTYRTLNDDFKMLALSDIPTFGGIDSTWTYIFN